MEEELKTIRIKYWKDRPNNFTGIAINRFGQKAYFQNGKFHRLDGPAFEDTNGYKEWLILGQELTEKQHNLFRKLWEQTTVDKTEKAMLAYVTLVTMEEQTI